MAGDNTLSNMTAADLEEMRAATSNPNVRVVVELDDSTNGTKRGTIENGAITLTSVGSEVDTGKKESLSDFISWAKQTYPANHYALVLWSHGDGWRNARLSRGALADDTSGSFMSMADIRSAISTAGGVDLVNFDACLMGMYEVAYELKEVASVMVASEETVPGTGQPYDKVINRLVANPDQDAKTLAAGIVDDSYAYYSALNHNTMTFSAIDLSKIGALHQTVQETAKLMVDTLVSNRTAIDIARSAAPYYTDSNFRDLAKFADNLASGSATSPLKAKATELATAARATVLNNKVLIVSADSTTPTNSTGLAIYLPNNSTTTSAELASYGTAMLSNASAVSGGSAWHTFLGQYVTTFVGTAAGNFIYKITWDNPQADLDLMINEPDSSWAGPSQGSLSANGTSSVNSYYSGLQLETYTANTTVSKGIYDVFVRYRGCASGISSCGATTVTIWRYDTSKGDTALAPVGTHVLSLTNKLPALSSFGSWSAFMTAVSSGTYTDWYYFDKSTRAGGNSLKTAPAVVKDYTSDLQNWNKR